MENIARKMSFLSYEARTDGGDCIYSQKKVFFGTSGSGRE